MTKATHACGIAAALFVGGVFLIVAPLVVVIGSVAFIALWVIGAALWDLATAPREDPYLSAWDIRSSHTPDRKRVTR